SAHGEGRLTAGDGLAVQPLLPLRLAENQVCFRHVRLELHALARKGKGIVEPLLLQQERGQVAVRRSPVRFKEDGLPQLLAGLLQLSVIEVDRPRLLCGIAHFGFRRLASLKATTASSSLPWRDKARPRLLKALASVGRMASAAERKRTAKSFRGGLNFKQTAP